MVASAVGDVLHHPAQEGCSVFSSALEEGVNVEADGDVVFFGEIEEDVIQS